MGSLVVFIDYGMGNVWSSLREIGGDRNFESYG
jgi:hypothetical protein